MIIRCFALLMGLSLATGYAEERRNAWGDVVSVAPITKRIIDPPQPGCQEQQPGTSQGLSALLRWDLANPCRTRQSTRVVAYEVTYRWNERTYTARRTAPPVGDRIPLQLAFEVQPSSVVR